MNEGLMLNFHSPDKSALLTFEDNGKVAYAYLKQNGKIVGDVWLYNRCPTPESPEWRNRDKIPFANSKEYVGENSRLEREVTDEDVLVDWEEDENGPVAYVYIYEDLYGVVGVGDKPGYARLAVKDSPIARVMEIDEDN
jgi:hypothetical protein